MPSSQCPRNECPFGGFQESASSTFQDLHDKFGIQYGIGSVNGTYAKDTVTVAGVSVPNQQFGLALTTEEILTSPTTVGGDGSSPPSTYNQSAVQGNGILGLGYPQLTAATTQGEPAYNPFVFNLVDQKLINQPVFSVYLNRADKEGWAGEIILGGIDKSKYSGDLQYLAVAQLTTSKNPLEPGKPGGHQQGGSGRNGYYYWMVYGQGVAVANGSESQDFRLDSMSAFILDTGTTLTYMPNKIALEVAAAITSPSGFQLDRDTGVLIVDCSTAQSPVQFQLQMAPSSSPTNNPVVLSVPVSELVIPLDGDTPETSSACMLGIAPLGNSGSISSNMFLVGDSLLRSTYLVFDMGQNRIGIAAANGVPGTVNGVNATEQPSGSTSLTPVSSVTALTMMLVLYLVHLLA